MKNIILIGMMGCGKSTLSVLLSEALGRPLVDTDTQIAEQEGRSIAEIFSAEGEAYFRALERELSAELGQREGLIISCGGGLPMNGECMAALKSSGTVIWLRRDPDETYDTMDHSGRPLAQQGRQDFLNRFSQREPVYRKWADIVIEDFSSPDHTLTLILEALPCEF